MTTSSESLERSLIGLRIIISPNVPTGKVYLLPSRLWTKVGAITVENLPLMRTKADCIVLNASTFSTLERTLEDKYDKPTVRILRQFVAAQKEEILQQYMQGFLQGTRTNVGTSGEEVQGS
jgi:hypothetical protein